MSERRVEVEESFQLILFPGLGADDRQFQPQKSAFAECLVPPWISPKRNESLAHYAVRLADGITPQRPMVLGGSSFGGMVAQEMAGRLEPDAVVLIGSCRSPRAIRPLLRSVGRSAAMLPPAIFELTKPFSPLTVGLLSGAKREHLRLCATMYQDADSAFVKWATGAIFRWKPTLPQKIPVFHIHGENDRVIPAARVEANEIVPGGGHLINLTHPEDVNAFIRQAFRTVA